MPATLVESSVILDVLSEDDQWLDWSADRLSDAARTGMLVINPVIDAEVAVGFERIEDLDDAADARRPPLSHLFSEASHRRALKTLLSY